MRNLSLRGLLIPAGCFLVLSETKGAIATKLKMHPEQAVRFIIFKNYKPIYINTYKFRPLLNKNIRFYNC